MKKLFRYFLFAIVAIVLIVGLLTTYAILTDYTPPDEIVEYEAVSSNSFTDSAEINLMIWNIGYAGLSAEMDFFYDNGKQVRTTKEQAQVNLTEIKNFIKNNAGKDFYLFQEIDKNAKRSYGVNQFDELGNVLENYYTFFGINYKVPFVPVPLHSPMGKVFSGIMTASKFQPTKSSRYSFPGNFSFPTNLFMLDRCFLVNRYPVSDGSELIVINTHNSAFDDGSLRKAQMIYLKTFLEAEYEKGNYVIVGGDWNQCAPNFSPNFDGYIFDEIDKIDIASDFLPAEWNWLLDNTTPSNRRVYMPWKKAETRTTVIDFYLLSPNILPIKVETVNLNFQNSDHQPVKASVKLVPKKNTAEQ